MTNQAKVTTTFEPYVPAEPVAQLLSITPRRVLEMARSGRLPAHPIGKGRHRTWRFRLSEIDGIFLGNEVDHPLQSNAVVPGVKRRNPHDAV